jgi:hypothetical protein
MTTQQRELKALLEDTIDVIETIINHKDAENFEMAPISRAYYTVQKLKLVVAGLKDGPL